MMEHELLAEADAGGFSTKMRSDTSPNDAETEKPVVNAPARRTDDPMSILVYNWRCIENPDAGGAEVFTHEVLKRLVRRGHEATLFTSTFDDCDHEEVIDGVRIVRAGGRFTVYGHARKHYPRFRGDFDVVVDEINGPPFMTPMYAEEPVVALIHHIVRNVWFYEMPFPVDTLGYRLEDWWLKSYKNVPTMTVSTSTKRDLLDLGFDDVAVLPEGLECDPLDDVPEKPDRPTFIFVGRMKNAKRPHHAIEAFDRIKRRYPEAVLHMVGDGPLLDDIRARTDESVVVHGYVSEERKRQLMKRSHVLLVPSVREGWGLVVTEANAMGTPAAGYNVKGLRDSITNGVNGLLAAPDPMRLAQRALTIFETRYDAYADSAIETSSRYDWEKTATYVERVLRNVVQ